MKTLIFLLEVRIRRYSRDADEEIIPNQFRGLSKNYIKLITLVDYPSSIERMNKEMPQYKPRYKRDLNEVRKEYYNCS